MTFKTLLLTLCLFSFGLEAHSFENLSFGIGIEYFAQNSLGKITKSDDGSASSLGAASYPLYIKFDWNFTSNWFLSPELAYTLLPRKSAGDAAETTMIDLIFPFGKQILSSGEFSWDWQAGPGIAYYKIDGQGGVESLNNGTSTSSFARPGGSSKVQNYILDLATIFNYSKSSVELSVIVEGLFSSGKRTESLVLGYLYHF